MMRYIKKTIAEEQVYSEAEIQESPHLANFYCLYSQHLRAVGARESTNQDVFLGSSKIMLRVVN